ncbi:hypothetical protein JOM56_010992 [Amanita muscaria]
MSSLSSSPAIPSAINHPGVPTSESSVSTIRGPSPVDSSSPILITSTTSSPKTLSPKATPPGGRANLTFSPLEQSAHQSASRSLTRLTSLDGTPTHKSSLSLPADHRGSGIRDRSRSPLGRIDDILNHWKDTEVADMRSKSPSGWWTKLDKKKMTVEMQEPVPELQHVRNRVLKAAASVLGPTIDITRHALNAGVDLLELAPIPGLAQAARTLLEIWDALDAVDMNRIACFRLTERCAEILLSVREEIHEAGDEVGEDLKLPIDKLIESFSLVYNLLHKMNRRPFLKRYLKRDEILRQISECDKGLTDALGMLSISIQLRILKQVQAGESQRQRDHIALLDRLVQSNPPGNALQLTGVDTSPTAITDLQPVQSPSVDVPSLVDRPKLVVNDVPKSFSGVIPQLRQIHDQQNAHDAAKDLADLRHLMSVALQTTNDAQVLEVLQIGRDEMPEAIKTLQRALEKIIERDQPFSPTAIAPIKTVLEPLGESETETGKPGFLARRTYTRPFKGRQNSFLKRSKTVSSSESKVTNAVSSESAGQGRVRDTLDREFVESGLYALRRMSQGVEVTLPSWTITRYEVDREEKIGIGFFSDVYKGKWRGRTVAIKVLAETTPRELFVKETEIWKSLHHPNVLELYGASSATSDPPWFFVSPYEKNGSLPAHLRRMELSRGALSPVASQSTGLVPGSGSSSSIRKNSPTRDSLLKSSLIGNLTARGGGQLSIGDVPKELDLYRFMHEIAKGMDYLHNIEVTRGNSRVTGIVHGDLKAANVLIDDRFHCVISDFGQSEMKSEAYRISGLPLPHGTLRWQAPELMEGAHIMTTAMDIYAFAICCVEILLLGRIPWPSNDDSDVRHLVLVEDKRPAIPDISPFNSSALNELIHRCWDKDPSRRPTFTTIVEEIEFVRRNAGQHPEDHTPRTSEIIDVPRGRPSPEMPPIALPVHNNSFPDVHAHTATQKDHLQQRHSYAIPEPSSARSSVFTHTTSSEESFAFVHQLGYESPIPHDHQALERKYEMRYRMHLMHDFHPSLTLPLWEPAQIRLGAVGYLSRPSGSFVTLFDAFSPYRASNEEARKIPSLYGYGKVERGMQRLDKRNAAQRGLDMITGLLKFGNNTRNVARRYSYPLRSGHKASYMCVEATVYRYVEKLDAPKRWFADNIGRILKIYAQEHPITREDLFLVVGTLDSVDHALFVSHKHPDAQLHFDVFAVPRNGQPWGKFTIDTQRSPAKGPDYRESANIRQCWDDRVSSAGEDSKTVLLARLRFKPDNPEPTSL